MSDLHSQLRDYVESTIERVDVDDVVAAVAAERGPGAKPILHRQPVWVAAGAAVVVILLIGLPLLLIGGSDSTPSDATTATTAAPTTAPPNPDAVEEAGTGVMETPPINVTWTLEATLDGWLAEPVAHDGGFVAMHKSLDEDAEPNVDGHLEGRVETNGRLWESTDGVTWRPARDGDQSTPPQPRESSTDASVTVLYDPGGDPYGYLVTDRLVATTDGVTWREINLRPHQDDWVPRVVEGELGWIVYSPPRQVRLADSSLGSSPRYSNLGLWYTPDTEVWFEVTNLGPLVDTYENVGALAVIDAAMLVRDYDVIVLAHIAEHSGFGIFNQLQTEIWRLELSRGEPVEAFDFSTQSLCDWFSPEDISAIVTSTYEEVGVPLDPQDEMEQREGQNSDCYWADPIVTLSERHEPVDWAGTTRAQHPALDDSVLVSIHEPGFYGMMTGLDALLRVDGHPEPLWFGHTTPESVSGDVETINTLGLSIANKMLKEMGWIE